VNPKTAQGLNAGFGIEIRGGGEFTVRFTDGAYGVEPAGSLPIDCTISADPAAFLLVGTGRLSQWPAIALGRYSPGGPDPQLALRFVDLFLYP
jgi:putative sterol carrier protein